MNMNIVFLNRLPPLTSSPMSLTCLHAHFPMSLTCMHALIIYENMRLLDIHNTGMDPHPHNPRMGPHSQEGVHLQYLEHKIVLNLLIKTVLYIATMVW